ncbi:siderophore-interacting protein [Pseudoclavibacter endophyticus]|uniref:Siderophore-interacting protein n=1 Tax=Pseudoclavibacter endophyticus TaxID=1778590 RepID=A0A6H9WV08_9MICO|nr:siderophore-interacting protein [Pseudoclavibacter endophyticus]KAB1650334.1 siderophore-interacting protein [Pseudoclavibacter endophyticus]GGA55035.1 siderophore-interacting protein [Pseudoclavibacter endophyticus]
MTAPLPRTDRAPRPGRQARPQVVLDVISNERISDHLVRLTLGGDGFADYVDKAATDKYVKILFADPALGLTPPYDLNALRETLAPKQLPVRRTYTVRSVDAEAGTLQIEFVVHGDEGVAGPWAATAKPGDRLCFNGPGGMFEPDPDADWYFFAGDESAIPAIAATLEAMAPDAVGLAIVEVAGPGDELALRAPDGIEVRWMHRGGPFTPDRTQLAEAVAAVAADESPDWREGDVQVFAHGEREVMKRLRRTLGDERGIDRKRLSLSAYWAYGREEEAFQAEKQAPVGQIFPD